MRIGQRSCAFGGGRTGEDVGGHVVGTLVGADGAYLARTEGTVAAELLVAGRKAVVVHPPLALKMRAYRAAAAADDAHTRARRARVVLAPRGAHGAHLTRAQGAAAAELLVAGGQPVVVHLGIGGR